ncbi:MAG: ribbon-helix-helix domain-containing protein [Pseudolabrys sp.]
MLEGNSVIKRSVVIGGHKTTISLENQFWSALKEIAQAQGATLAQTHRQPRCTDNLVNEFRSHRNRSRSPMPSGAPTCPGVGTVGMDYDTESVSVRFQEDCRSEGGVWGPRRARITGSASDSPNIVVTSLVHLYDSPVLMPGLPVQTRAKHSHRAPVIAPGLFSHANWSARQRRES